MYCICMSEEAILRVAQLWHDWTEMVVMPVKTRHCSTGLKIIDF